MTKWLCQARSAGTLRKWAPARTTAAMLHHMTLMELPHAPPTAAPE